MLETSLGTFPVQDFRHFLTHLPGICSFQRLGGVTGSKGFPLTIDCGVDVLSTASLAQRKSLRMCNP